MFVKNWNFSHFSELQENARGAPSSSGNFGSANPSVFPRNQSLGNGITPAPCGIIHIHPSAEFKDLKGWNSQGYSGVHLKNFGIRGIKAAKQKIFQGFRRFPDPRFSRDLLPKQPKIFQTLPSFPKKKKKSGFPHLGMSGWPRDRFVYPVFPGWEVGKPFGAGSGAWPGSGKPGSGKPG